MWSEAVGLRLKILVLVMQVWDYYVLKHDLVTLVIIMILKDTATFQVHVLFIVSLFRCWNITTVKITVAYAYLKVKSAKCFCLLPVVLVLIFCS